MMKGSLVAALVFCAILLPIGAQGQAASQGPVTAAKGNLRWAARQLKLSPAEIKAIGDIADRQVDGIAKAASEMRIIEAKLERLLLDTKPDMGAIKQLVRGSLDWELQIRMARIERAIDLRKLLGPERWAMLQRLQREYLQMKRTGAYRQGELGENAESLAALLDRLE